MMTIEIPNGCVYCNNDPVAKIHCYCAPKMSDEYKIKRDAELMENRLAPPNTLHGIQIIIRPTLPEFAIIPRRWKERFFTLPWQPFVKTKRVDFPDNVENNRMIMMVDGKIFATAKTADKLMKDYR